MLESVTAQAIADLGGPSAVARMRDCSPWAVTLWIRRGIPADHVLWLAERTDWKYTPHQISPNLYPHADDGLPVDRRGNSPEGVAA